MVKPRLRKVADLIPLLDLSALKFERTKLLYKGEPCVYAGHHDDRLIWLRRGRKLYGPFDPNVVLPDLKLA